MPLVDPRELRAAVPTGSRVLGLDVGSKTIGTALSDTRLVIASPLETIRRRRFRDDAAALFALIDRHGVGGLVIGLPLALAGNDSPRTQSVRQFARNVLALRDLPVAFWDERLSTAAVTREMIAHDMTRKRRAEIVDRVAAAYILQGCLDAIGRSPHPQA
jgi:putative Holliday junction resolvase